MSRVRGRTRWLTVAALLALTAGCGAGTAAPAPGKTASLNLTLKSVPIVRSIKVSAIQRNFGNCRYGKAADNTASQPGKLGYPNSVCWIGLAGPAATFPITITNTGIAAYMEVSGQNARPSVYGSQWSLCNIGGHPAVACTGSHGKPGVNQYLLQNFGPGGRINAAGLTDTPVCDHEFSPTGNCWAVQGASQTEGIKLTGPSMSTDTSTTWTVTITWTPVPGPG